MKWLQDWIAKVLITKYLGNALKTAIAALGGYLIAKGIASQEQAQSLTTAILELIPGILAILLKLWASAVSRRVLLDTPPPIKS